MHVPWHLARTPLLRRWLALAGATLLCCVASGPLAAREFPYPPGSTPHFRHLTDEDGLAATNVYAVAQDPAGYMWIATDGGLQRYDGYRFVNYNHNPRVPTSLAENVVTSLAFAPDGTLWVGTQDAGLDRLPPGATGFTHYQHDPEKTDALGNDQIYALLFDRHGRL